MILYYPDRSSPTTTLTITPYEVYPSNRRTVKYQSRDILAGGTPVVYNLGSTQEILSLSTELLSLADKDSLLSFLNNTVDWASKSFDLTDDQGNQYDSCRFWFDDLERTQRDYQLYDFELTILVP